MDRTRQVNHCLSPDCVVHLTQVGSAPGFLSFLSGYTVIIGPITGIMLTDVCRLFSLHCQSALSLPLSIGLFTARGSMFLQCIGLMAGIDTAMVW
jgi:hypothetical protein